MPEDAPVAIADQQLLGIMQNLGIDRVENSRSLGAKQREIGRQVVVESDDTVGRKGCDALLQPLQPLETNAVIPARTRKTAAALSRGQARQALFKVITEVPRLLIAVRERIGIVAAQDEPAYLMF